MSDREALKRLHSENGLAVLSGTTTMEYEMFLQKKQETYISKEPFVHGYYSSWMFGKGFPLQRNISAFLARTFETGIYQKVCFYHFLLASECFIKVCKSYMQYNTILQIKSSWTRGSNGDFKSGRRRQPPALAIEHLDQRKSFKYKTMCLHSFNPLTF